MELVVFKPQPLLVGQGILTVVIVTHIMGEMALIGSPLGSLTFASMGSWPG